MISRALNGLYETCERGEPWPCPGGQGSPSTPLTGAPGEQSPRLRPEVLQALFLDVIDSEVAPVLSEEWARCRPLGGPEPGFVVVKVSSDELL